MSATIKKSIPRFLKKSVSSSPGRIYPKSETEFFIHWWASPMLIFELSTLIFDQLFLSSSGKGMIFIFSVNEKFCVC